ncbi:MAG TPA: tetratricopeptide repeat protein [Candidatus Cryosericum sp.]|nr:tetratricopeptide repeat protein [Candidatus Cryosericum sp.]
MIRPTFRSAPVACVALVGLCAGLGLGAAAAGAGDGPAAVEGREESEPAAQQEIQELVRQGNTLRQAGRLEDALTVYRSAGGLDPGRYEIHVLIADTARRLGFLDEATEEYVRATAIDPGRSEGYTGRALIQRARYDFTSAVAILEPAVDRTQGSERASILVSLGETRRREGRPDQAEAMFRGALQADASAAAAHYGLARLAEERGELGTAIAELDRYLEAKPDDGSTAQRRQEIGELDASIRALRTASRQEAAGGPPGAGLQAELGRLQAIAGDAPGAVASFRKALGSDPRHLDARRGLAQAMLRSGDARGAGEEFRRLLRMAPQDALALYHLAGLARRSGDRKAEEAAWSELFRRRPDDLFALRAYAEFVAGAGADALARALKFADPGVADRRDAVPRAARLRLRALLFSRQGSWTEAEAALYDALRLDPTDPWALDLVSEILAQRPQMLAALARRAGEEAGRTPEPASPAQPLLVILLGRCHSLAGRDEQALLLARQAVALRPDSAAARSFLAEMLQSAGDTATALQELQRAVDLDPTRPAAHVDLALALLRKGRAAAAEAAARNGLRKWPESSALLSLLGAALSERGDLEAGARAYAAALAADPADNFHLARGQYPALLAALGRNLEARRALEGPIPEFPDLAYLEAWGFARDTYRDRTFHDQDWQAWRDKYRGRLQAAQDAHKAIAEMLGSLGDAYTRLRDPEETALVLLARHGGAPGVDALGRNRPTSPTVVARQLPGGLGYIQIANLSDPNVVAEVRKALLALKDTEGIVLDLRGNPGGLARSADDVADLLIGPGQKAGTDVGPGGESPRITGGEGALTNAPITVLVDAQTASAAERLAAGLEATGRGTIQGGETFGKGLFQNARILPGGYTVLVSAGEALGPDGRPIQGRGLRPRQKDPDPQSNRPEP